MDIEKIKCFISLFPQSHLSHRACDTAQQVHSENAHVDFTLGVLDKFELKKKTKRIIS
jgi:hypothetical protein